MGLAQCMPLGPPVLHTRVGNCGEITTKPESTANPERSQTKVKRYKFAVSLLHRIATSLNICFFQKDRSVSPPPRGI